MIIASERLALTPLTVDDVERLVGLDADPAVMASLTNGRPTTRAEADAQVRPLVRHAEEHAGFGRRIGRLLRTDEPIGWFSLVRLPDRPGEVEYVITRAAYERPAC